MFTLDVPFDVYTLPRDGEQARQDFLALLHTPEETWIRDYGFTEQDLCTEIEAVDAAGTAVHLLLDWSQFEGQTEHPVVLALLAKLQHSDLTITTAGPLSKDPRQIMHTKALVTRATDGGAPWCWVGSVNFSNGGWLQANYAVRFRSEQFAEDFISDFAITQAWALQHVPQPKVALVPVGTATPVATITPTSF